MPIPEPECLTDGWALTRNLEHDPLGDLTLLKYVRGPESIVFVVHGHQILDNGVGLPDRVAVLVMIY